MAAQAAAPLRDSGASAIAKRLAGSVLSQCQSANQTGKQMETIAAQVLRSPKYSDETKSLAASVVAQSSNDR